MIPLLQSRELDYRLIKELWVFRENRIAVRFAYEWRDESGHWFRNPFTKT
jgi:nuclear transport factor 2 (NTF2) superfamily protein